MKCLFIYLIFINIVAFSLCYIDKRRAIKSKRRIKERTLILFSMLGGCYLFYIAMYLFHHKTRKIKFYLGIPIIIILYSVFIYSLVQKYQF